MKRFIAVTATLFASAMINSVNAADMPLKAPVPRPVYDWTGFYLGINGGYSWGRSDTDYTRPGIAAFSSTQNLDGWLFGGQAGYNWQFNRNWIFGLEADIQGTGQRGDRSASGHEHHSLSSSGRSGATLYDYSYNRKLRTETAVVRNRAFAAGLCARRPLDALCDWRSGIRRGRN